MGIKIENPNSNISMPTGNWWEELLLKEISLTGNSFNNRKKAAWYDELSVLLTSGIQLKQALELLVDTQKKEKEQQLVKDMLSKLVDGVSFSEIIRSNKVFSDYEYYALKIGEQTGKLNTITKELSVFYQRKDQQRKEIMASLTYPIIVLITAVIIIAFMLRFVVPMFVDIFKQNRVELPVITKAIIRFSDFMGTYGVFLLFLGVSFFVVLKLISKNQWFREISGAIQLKLPVLGTYIQNIYLAQFTQALALLISSKVSITESLELVSKMIKFYPLEKALNESKGFIVKGEKLSKAFAKYSIFDKKMLALIRVSEETNQTEYIFKKLSEQYNQQVKYQSQIVSNLLNPILTIFVGVIVGVILVAMYLPMFKLSSVLG